MTSEEKAGLREIATDFMDWETNVLLVRNILKNFDSLNLPAQKQALIECISKLSRVDEVYFRIQKKLKGLYE